MAHEEEEKKDGDTIPLSDRSDKSDAVEQDGTGWGMIAVGTVMVIAGGILAYKYMNAPK